MNNFTSVEPKEEASTPDFSLIGVGTSAGGLEALKSFISLLPNKLGASYVLIQHLEPSHKSILVDILSRHTVLKVISIADGMVIETGNIYVLPSGKNLSIENGIFRLSNQSSEETTSQQIDIFFRSLAECFREKAIAVILTGTLNDGSCGIKLIKENGGMVIAQSPETAEFPEMPENAIKTGYVDLILDLPQIPDAIEKYLEHAYISGNLALKNLDELEQILTIVKAAANYDFRFYKKNTLIRRILRRMGLKNIESMNAYANLIQENPAEALQLFKDLLIGVTEFFRDEEVWKKLQNDVFRKIIKALPDNSPIRVWIPGCSSGEEAYSVAIILYELFEEYNRPFNAQIFATDIDENAIANARTGIFPAIISEKVSKERLRRFFTIEENGFRINRTIRESIIFAAQNLISDAPFSDLDFISCRNLLIYLDPEIQKSIIDLFSFSLRDGGYLLLGCSETVGYKNDLFECVSKKLRIYKLTGNKRGERLRDSAYAAHLYSSRMRRRENKPSPFQQSLESIMHTQLLRRYAPAAVIINNRSQIVYFYGQTERYLNLPKNEPNFDVIAMAREGIKNRLRTALHKAQKENTTVQISGIQVSRSNKSCSVKIDILPLSENGISEGMFLISFADEELLKMEHCVNCSSSANEEPLVKQLEQELNETREDLQNTIEELETSNEELKASNEEMMSMNEELQSTNEELETSKEELQSLNEELNSVNSQLRSKVEELEIANNDIINFINCTDVATVFLDRNSIIRKFTPAARQLFSLIPSDIGRPIDDLNNRLKEHNLSSSIDRVLKTLVAESKEIESSDGKFFIRNINPFRTEDDRIDGVIITFVDVTEIKENQLALKASEKRLIESNNLLKVILHHTHFLSAYLDTDFNYILVNHAFAKNFNQPEDFFPGKNHFIQYPNAEYKAIFTEVVATGQPYFVQGKPFVFAHQPERGLTYWDWSLIPVKNETGQVSSLVFTLVDATSRIKAEIMAKEETKKKNQILESIKDGFFSLNSKFKITYFNLAAEKILGIKAEQAIGKTIKQVFPKEFLSIFEKQLCEAHDQMQPNHYEAATGNNENIEWFEVRTYPFSDGVTVYFSDITEAKKAQQKIQEQAQALQLAQKIAQVGSWQWDIRQNQISWSDEIFSIYGLKREETTESPEILLSKYVHPEDLEKVQELRRQIDQNRPITPCEFRIIRPDGELRTIWGVPGNLIRDEAGNPFKISGIVHDVTERKKLEIERLQLEKMANRNQKIEALGALAGGIAHNFNNFLCGIFGNIELALYDSNPVKKEAFLKTALSSMEPARALTRQLITFARGGEPELVNAEIMPCIVEAAQFGLTGSNIKLKTSSGSLHPCLFDPGQIGQVINNLVLNSRQAMVNGGEIEIHAANFKVDRESGISLPPGEYVKISFSDNGPGISEKFAANIFDPFFSTKQGNQGLGLAISYSIIARHGGMIMIDSSHKPGCAFNIFLPKAVKRDRLNSKAPERTDYQLSGKILVMDDEEIIRDILFEMLSGMGFEVKAVTDGQQVIEELSDSRNTYRALILDLTVPGKMGGKETCEIIRNSGKTLPVFAASGYAADPVIKSPEKFGFDGSIAKPFSMSALKDLLAPFFH